MRDVKAVQDELRRLGADKWQWGKPERDELPQILMHDEEIQHIINGRYDGGFATLVATNHRLLLVDKKMFFLTVEDIRYDMVAEVDYGHQFIGATIHVRSFSKDFKFQSFKKDMLREFTHFIQHRVMELRGHQTGRTSDGQPIRMDHYEAFPTQVFNEDINGDGINDLTPQQTYSLLPLDRQTWHKVSESRRLINPYTQTPLVTRRRVGRYDFAGKY